MALRSAAMLITALLIATPLWAQERRFLDQPSAADLPALAHELAMAQGAARLAAQELAQAQEALRLRRLQVTRNPESQAALREAENRVKQAHAQYVAAREQALADLAANPDYQRALAQRDEYAMRLAMVRDTAEMRTIDELAEMRLKYAAEVTRMQTQRVNASEAVTKARQALAEAQAALDALRAGQARAAETDSGLAQAQEKLREAEQKYQEARVRLAAADAAYRQALEAREIELRLSRQYLDVLDDISDRRYYYRYYGSPWSPFGFPIMALPGIIQNQTKPADSNTQK
jgi:DNA repair exonuclease SbcCD ATPase subunit